MEIHERRNGQYLGEECEKHHTGGDISRLGGALWGVENGADVDESILGREVGLSKDRGTWDHK